MLSESESNIRVFIENVAGSATKNTFDEQTLRFVRCDTVARPYPYPYGFVLDTLSGDGDCVDCFVITQDAYCSADIVACTPIHLLEQIEDGEIDHKVLAVPAGRPAIAGESAIADIRGFIQSVFSHIPNKQIQLGTLHGAVKARDYIQSCRLSR